MKTDRAVRLQLAANAVQVRSKRYIIHSYQLHWHTFYEIELVLEGEGVHELNGVSYPLSPGEMYLLRPTDFHRLDIPNSCVVRQIQIPTGCLGDQMEQALLMISGNLEIHLSEEELAEMESLCGLLQRKSEQDVLNQALLAQLLGLVILLFLDHRGSGISLLCQAMDDRVGQVIGYIREHCREDLSVGDIAAHFFLNKNYLCSLFRRQTGITLLDCVRQQRLDYAARLAVTTNLPSIEIGAACGYRSVSNFLRDFKRRFNMSPLQMRERSRLRPN